MTNLAELQQQFQAYLLHHDPRIEQAIVNNDHVCAEERLTIYADAYYLRLIEVLTSNYPILQQLLGDELFDQLARAYIKAYPSSYRSIRWYGDQLSQFIQTHFNKIEAQNLMAEVAQFEWALRDVFDAADADIVQEQQLAALPAEHWPTLCLQFHPSLRLLTLQWNAVAVWQALDQQQICPAFQQTSSPTTWLLWRKHLQSHFRSLPVHEAWALQTMLQGENFTTLCAGLTEWIDETHCALQAATLLKQWIYDGLICAINNH